jgi:hypothetical protein
MISRLIDKNIAERNEAQAEDLMLALFAAAPRADGALAEGLGIAYSEKLRDQTALFLSSYKSLFAPTDARLEALGGWDREVLRTSRSDVSRLLLSVNHLSPEDVSRIEQKMNAIQDSSREFDEARKELRGKYFKPYGQRRRNR